jgi:hypothetical protein
MMDSSVHTDPLAMYFNNEDDGREIGWKYGDEIDF